MQTDLTSAALQNYKRRPSKFPTPAILPKPVPQKRSDSKKPKTEAKPTFSTFKQFHRTASLSDLINEDDDNKTNNQSNKNIQLETASLASIDVNIPEPVLPPTKSITVQTDEVDLDSATVHSGQNLPIFSRFFRNILANRRMHFYIYV